MEKRIEIRENGENDVSLAQHFKNRVCFWLSNYQT